MYIYMYIYIDRYVRHQNVARAHSDVIKAELTLHHMGVV